jgi:hypothetical protein
MSRRAGATTAGQDETEVKPQDNGQQKQVMLLAQDTGHFSMIRYILSIAKDSSTG